MKIKQFFTGKNLIWLVFIFIFIVGALEIFGRVYLSMLHKSVNPKFQFDSYRIYSHIPNFREGDGKKDWMIINGQGFRRTAEVTKEKPASTFRVFLMGGSSAHGASSAAPYPIRHLYNEETVDACIERMMKEKYPEHTIEIINAAVTGYQVFQHTAYIQSELLDYNPDLIIFLDGANDHYTFNRKFNYYGDNRYQFWKQRLQHPSVGGMTDYFFLWLSKQSAFAKGFVAWRRQRDAMANNKISDMAKSPPADTDVLLSDHRLVAKKQFLRNIDINVVMLHNYGIGSILCFQPHLCLRTESLCSDEEKKFYVPHKNTSALYPVIVSELDSLAKKNHVPFVDLVPCFNNEALKGKQLLIDYAHYSALGASEIAKKIFPEVENYFRENILHVQDSSTTDSVR